ncbi:MAG: hypothetical protein DME56_00830 [Verrucomicrobia bacterium]|nr:MAG: hypothetical protein DME56_00830 [Verrucomicrobiota bacterium]PYU79498.1 MAG: hypothetical protein DMG50_23730 [Acidobacteriota bacterium]
MKVSRAVSKALVAAIGPVAEFTYRITGKPEGMQTAEAAAFARMPLGRDSPKLLRWPFPPLRPKRVAYGVAGLRSESGQRKQIML